MWYWNGWVNLWWCWLLHRREGIKIYQDYSWICINFCLPVFRLQLLNERKSALGTSAFDESESDGEAEKPKKQDLGGLWIAEFTEFWAKKWPGCWEEQLACWFPVLPTCRPVPWSLGSAGPGSRTLCWIGQRTGHFGMRSGGEPMNHLVWSLDVVPWVEKSTTLW